LYGQADTVDLSPKEEEGSDQGESPSVKAEEVEDLEEKPPVIVPAVFCRPFEPVSFHLHRETSFRGIIELQTILDNGLWVSEPWSMSDETLRNILSPPYCLYNFFNFLLWRFLTIYATVEHHHC